MIITDAVFLSGLWLATKKHCDHEKQVVRIMMAANAGLLIVDHIHFQYNGLLLGDLRHKVLHIDTSLLGIGMLVLWLRSLVIAGIVL